MPDFRPEKASQAFGQIFTLGIKYLAKCLLWQIVILSIEAICYLGHYVFGRFNFQLKNLGRGLEN